MNIKAAFYLHYLNSFSIVELTQCSRQLPHQMYCPILAKVSSNSSLVYSIKQDRIITDFSLQILDCDYVHVHNVS